MKRSQVNEIIQKAEEFALSRSFYLPPFAHWSLENWQQANGDLSKILDTRLGWDITDFGSGTFEKVGLTLFTIRNGSQDALNNCEGKIYAEKLLIVEEGQITPLHFHWIKTEDIINRGGGDLVIQLYNSTDEDGLADTEITVMIDSVPRMLKAGDSVVLKPGESIMLTPRLYHAFWASGERVLVGEVSSVNDDNTDNRFFHPAGRFPVIEEDVLPYRLLVNDYGHFLNKES